MDDKSELLNQLKIDRSEADTKNGLSAFTVVILIIVSVLIGGAGTYYWLDQKLVPSSQNIPVRTLQNTAPVPKENAAVNTATAPATDAVARADTTDRILNASGYITARRIATVSAQLTGLLVEVEVEEGMRVENGQVLAKLDNAVAKVDLQFAEAQVMVQRAFIENTQANLIEARKVLARVQDLKNKDFSSDADYTRAQANVAGLEAQIKSGEANVRVAELEASRQRERLDDHTIRAPFAGVVTVKAAQPGEIVSPVSAGGGFTRTGICTIVDMSSLEIEVDVNEAFIGRVFEGQKVEANLDAYPEWTIPASVIAIIPTADRAKATVKVRIKIETNDTRILPDMGVKVAFLKA